MTWFQQITGFPEADYDTTQSLLHVEGEQLVSRHSPRRWGIGRFEIPSRVQLRQHVAEVARASGKMKKRPVISPSEAYSFLRSAVEHCLSHCLCGTMFIGT